MFLSVLFGDRLTVMNVDESFESDARVVPRPALLGLQVTLLGSLACFSEDPGGLVLGQPLVLAGTDLDSALDRPHAGLPLVLVGGPRREMLLLLGLVERVLALLDLGLWEVLLIPPEFG